MAPGLGAVSGPYLKKGEFQVNAGLSRFETKDQFGGGAFEGNQQRTDLYQRNAQVNEGGVTLDLHGSYGLTRQLSLNLSVPVILFSHWSTVLAGLNYGPTLVVANVQWNLTTPSHCADADLEATVTPLFQPKEVFVQAGTRRGEPSRPGGRSQRRRRWRNLRGDRHQSTRSRAVVHQEQGLPALDSATGRGVCPSRAEAQLEVGAQ